MRLDIIYWLGVDIGSTTVKAVLVDPVDKSILFKKYVRHGARQRLATQDLFRQIAVEFPGIRVVPVFCGSGSRNLALELEAPYSQEVITNSLAVREMHPGARVAIELGGQDAKIIYFHKDEQSEKLVVSDMRMNGSCAGGTGAFLDEVASLLKIPVEGLNELAAQGQTVYDVSGRCGVFAKTDIQPLLNRGVHKADIALSCFHAVAKQTIGGLAQGLEIHPPVIFEGGPLHFNPALIDVYSQRLNLNSGEVIHPENPEMMIAYGAALAVPVMFSEEEEAVVLESFMEHEAFTHQEAAESKEALRPFFTKPEEKTAFHERHILPPSPSLSDHAGTRLEVYLGIDAGSTTSKFVLLDARENLVYSFYGKNHGEPLKVVQAALIDLKLRCDELDIELHLLGAGTTGYGEQLFSRAFHADYHTVETVAHAEAALKYSPEASFILDIGGQDMKAIFLNSGIVTGITLNEACSAGCGSFLENFAESLNIPVDEISEKAFMSADPSVLGSRCTVFMNSSVITEQKNGKLPEDIMAGLCNSVIENVFTKVIRLSNLKALGRNIVVQGGTLRNDAVLRALEIYTGAEVKRAPYPGEMGAIGIALLTKKQQTTKGLRSSSFIGWEDLLGFSYSQETGLICPYCSNNCNRTRISFSSGSHIITGNRCERGEVIGEAHNPQVKEELKRINRRRNNSRDLFRYREKILFKDYSPKLLAPAKDLTIGIPRVLEFWHSYPFWSSFFRSLGFRVQLSAKSSVKIFESGLSLIPSDTICFPAKLAHGHIQNLVEKQVDRIFMPIMNRMITENKSIYSEHACAVLKGYPMVLRNNDEPFEKHGIPMDTPNFHWTDSKARRKSITEYMSKTFGLPERLIMAAIEEGDRATEEFNRTLTDAGQELLDSLEEKEFAVVIAGRPYHSDELINHNLSDYFSKLGIPTLPLDALQGLNEVDLSPVRAELTVNFHVRMFAGAQIAAAHPKLEYAQIVSFGCGHDAVISDEVTRLLKQQSGKSPLILKMDESEVSGPLNIRVKSFVETVKSQREKGLQFYNNRIKAYEVQYKKREHEKIILIPNVTWAFAQMATAAIRKQGFRVEAMPIADTKAIKLGKKYVHNDMCFPAQINIGEFLSVLDQGKYNPDEVVLGLAKAQCDCRLAHYAMMARQALDDAGYGQIPIITTDTDKKNLHPGFKLSPLFELRMLWGLIMNDILEDLRRKIRPYELNKGETDAVFERAVNSICQGFDTSLKSARNAFEQAIEKFRGIDYDRSTRKPRVFMIGEFLLNFHPSSNNRIEEYLEKNGIEVMMPNLFYNMHREYLLEIDQKEEYHVSHPALQIFFTKTTNRYIHRVLRTLEEVGSRHPLWEGKPPLEEIAERSHHIIDKTFTSGEGWMIAGEILHHADHGVKSFLILQPFGCIPNHVTGRGLVKRIKRDKPDIQILSLDYDPDTSFANVENRLQMLIINTKERQKLV